MNRFKAVRAQIDAAQVDFFGAAGEVATVGQGTIRALYTAIDHAAPMFAFDTADGVRVVIDESFDLKSLLLASASGDVRADLRAALERFQLFAPGVPIQPVPAQPTGVAPRPVTNAMSPLPERPTAASATPAPPAPLGPAPVTGFDLPKPKADSLFEQMFAPLDAGPNAGASGADEPPALVGTAIPATAASGIQLVDAPADLPPPPLVKEREPTCTNCNKAMARAPSHFMINERPWCEQCGAAALEPLIGTGIWMAVRFCGTAALVATAWFFALRQQWSLALGAPLAAIAGLVGLFVLMRRDAPPDQPAERFDGPPGGRGKKLPTFDLRQSMGWLTARRTEEGRKVIALAASLVFAAVGFLTFAKPTERFPRDVLWGDLDYAFRGARTVAKSDVTVALFLRPQQSPQEATSSVSLLRGSLKPPALEKLIDEEATRLKWHTRTKIDEQTFCYRASSGRDEGFILITIARCPWGGCAVQTAAVAEVGGTCFPKAEMITQMKELLTRDWTR